MHALEEFEAEKEKRKSENYSKASRDRWKGSECIEKTRQTIDKIEAKKHKAIVDSGRDYVTITCQDKDCCPWHFLMYKSDYDKKCEGKYEKSCKMCARRLKKWVPRAINRVRVGDKYWKVEVIRGRNS